MRATGVGVTHRLSAWQETTITSSSCSSSGTAVRKAGGCVTGSRPHGAVFLPKPAGFRLLHRVSNTGGVCSFNVVQGIAWSIRSSTRNRREVSGSAPGKVGWYRRAGHVTPVDRIRLAAWRIVFMAVYQAKRRCFPSLCVTT